MSPTSPISPSRIHAKVTSLQNSAPNSANANYEDIRVRVVGIQGPQGAQGPQGIQGPAGSVAPINDLVAASDSVWSSLKTQNEINSAISSLESSSKIVQAFYSSDWDVVDSTNFGLDVIHNFMGVGTSVRVLDSANTEIEVGVIDTSINSIKLISSIPFGGVVIVSRL